MMKIYRINAYKAFLLVITSIQLLYSCGSVKTEDTVTPSKPSTPSSKFQNPEGQMTAEVDGKLIEMGISISSSQLRASFGNTGETYQIYGSVDDPKEGVKSISISLYTRDTKRDISTLKGIHKSSDVINGIDGTVSLSYSIFNVEKRSTLSWYTDANCTVEITSTIAPWIEGTFTVEKAFGRLGQTPITVEKGAFKIRYTK